MKTCGIFHSFAGHWQLIAEALRLKTVWYYENEPKTRQIIENNRPELNIIDDASEIEKVDIIMGSPPCVGMSQANPKACIEHPANIEMFKFSEAVAMLQPEYFFMEMVPTITQKRFSSLYNKLLKTFKQTHKTLVKTFNYKDYKVPQSRKRVFFYGNTKRYIPWPEKIGESNIREAFKGLPNYSRKEAIDNKLAIRIKPKWKGPYSMLEKKPEYFYLDWDGISPTVTALGTMYFRHPDRHRRITYREAARLMEFPDNYSFEPHSLSMKFRDVGWGVPILGTAKILYKILNYDILNKDEFEKLLIKKSISDYF